MNLKNKKLIKGFVILGNGTPNGYVRPDYIGQLYNDQGTQMMYIAMGLNTFGWKCITGEGGSADPNVPGYIPNIQHSLAALKGMGNEDAVLQVKDETGYYLLEFKTREVID